MGKIIATVGISGSGKSTWAKAWVAEAPNRARNNRDEVRKALFGPIDMAKAEEYYSADNEAKVDAISTALMEGWIAEGRDIVVDNTHLHPLAHKELQELADKHGYTFETKVFRVTVEEAKANVAKRVAEGGLNVQDEFIDAQAEKFVKFKF
jgi:predicted kinase